MNDKFRAMALCALGLEKVLSNEIGKIGLEATGRAAGRVYFDADATGLFRANLELRTAERILLEAARFRAADFDALFEGSRQPDWSRFFARDDKLVIERVRSRDSQLSAQTSIQSIVHKAIYETLGRKYRIERMPETGRERSLRVYLEDDECVLGLDLSGEALHKRGWRRASGEAPLKETIAAGVLLLAGWRRRIPLLDPICGTGTLLIEAAHFALDRAPGLDRNFDIESMPLARDGATSAFVAERERARDAVRKDAEMLLVGRDSDPRVIDAARANAEHAGVAPLLDLKVGKAEEVRPMSEEGILLTNPPWGERMGTEAEAEALYARIGEAWGASSLAAERIFAGWGLGFVTNRADFGEFFGRRAPVEKEIINGSEEQWFHWFPEGWENRPDRARDFGARDRGKSGYLPRDKARRSTVKAPSRVRGESAMSSQGGPAREGRGGRPGEAPQGGRSYSMRPREPGSRDPGSRDQGSRGQGPREHSSRDQGSRGFGDRERGPRPEGPRGPSLRPGTSSSYRDRDRDPRREESRSYGPRREDTREAGSRRESWQSNRPGSQPRPDASRDQGPRGQSPGGQSPRDQASRDENRRPDRPLAPRNPPPNDRGPREHSSRDQGSREQSSRDQGPGPRSYGPKREGSRGEAPRGPDSRPSRPRDPGSRDEHRGPPPNSGGSRGRRSEGKEDPRKGWPGHR